MANSVDPDEMAHDEPSHQDLHYLQLSVLVFRDGKVMPEIGDLYKSLLSRWRGTKGLHSVHLSFHSFVLPI